MAKTIEQVIAMLPKEEQVEIERRSEEMLSEYMALQELRRARGMTQEELANILELPQNNISRFERRSDVKVSSLQKYIQAMGGELGLVAKFPDQAPIEISGFTEAR